jgi:hypothetical protein
MNKMNNGKVGGECGMHRGGDLNNILIEKLEGKRPIKGPV